MISPPLILGFILRSTPCELRHRPDAWATFSSATAHDGRAVQRESRTDPAVEREQLARHARTRVRAAAGGLYLISSTSGRAAAPH